jgi:regulatory protein
MKATDLLANQEQSSTILRQKLLARRYDAAEVDDALAKLKKYNYLDDDAACRQQFENFYAEGKLSVRQIVVKLIQRGFDQNFIEQLIPADVDEHERLAASRALDKKFSRSEFNRAKAWQFLSSRGFDGDVISSAVENFQQTD